MAKQIRVYRWIDGRKCELAATFDDLDDAKDYVEENNSEPGGHVYGIAPDDLPRAYYACSQYESSDGGSGYEWSCDGEFDTVDKAIAKAVETANSAMLEQDGTKIEVYIREAEAGLEDAEAIAAGKQIAYGRFEKSEQGEITANQLTK